MKQEDHYYSFALILGNEDSHILPHPNTADLDFIIERLRDMANQLEIEKKKQNEEVPDTIK